jgi:hypothetical protein
MLLITAAASSLYVRVLVRNSLKPAGNTPTIRGLNDNSSLIIDWDLTHRPQIFNLTGPAIEMHCGLVFFVVIGKQAVSLWTPRRFFPSNFIGLALKALCLQHILEIFRIQIFVVIGNLLEIPPTPFIVRRMLQ